MCHDFESCSKDIEMRCHTYPSVDQVAKEFLLFSDFELEERCLFLCNSSFLSFYGSTEMILVFLIFISSQKV